MSLEAAVDMDGGWRLSPHGGSVTWLLSLGWPVGPSPHAPAMGLLESLRHGDWLPPEQGARQTKPEVAVPFVTWLRTYHSVTAAGFNQSHRSSLVQGEGGPYKGVKRRR